MHINNLQIGIDGCRAGWFFSLVNDRNEVGILLFKKIKDGLSLLEDAGVVYIDMPIGLVQQKDEVRTIDENIRTELDNAFRSSVFTIPCKQAVYAANYKEASKINKEVLGKGISIQAWNICAKIKELDIFLEEHTQLKNIMKEAHPELSFQRINGNPLNHKKKTAEGKVERMLILESQFEGITKIYKNFRKKFLKKDVADDDILDSLVLAFEKKDLWLT